MRPLNSNINNQRPRTQGAGPGNSHQNSRQNDEVNVKRDEFLMFLNEKYTQIMYGFGDNRKEMSSNNQNIPPSHKRGNSLPKITKVEQNKPIPSEQDGKITPVRNSAQFYNPEKVQRAQTQGSQLEKLSRDVLSSSVISELEDSENEKDEMWDTNYTAKFEINRVKEENSRIKAKILSFEKQNVLLSKQIEDWGIDIQSISAGDEDVFLDNKTVQKIYEDPNFESVSLKKRVYLLRSGLKELNDAIAEEKLKLRTRDQNVALMKFDLKKLMSQTIWLQDVLRQTDYFSPEEERMEIYVHKNDKHTKNLEALVFLNQDLLRIKGDRKAKARKLLKEIEELKQNNKRQDDLQEELQDKLSKLISQNPTRKSMRLATGPGAKNITFENPSIDIGIDDEMLDIEFRDKIISENKEKIDKLQIRHQELMKKNILYKQDIIKEIELCKDEIGKKETQIHETKEAIEKKKTEKVPLKKKNSSSSSEGRASEGSLEMQKKTKPGKPVLRINAGEDDENEENEYNDVFDEEEEDGMQNEDDGET